MTMLAEIRFTVTEQHMKLLKRLNFRYDADCEFGAPCVDPKRPYGNSDVYGDIGTILDLETTVFAHEEPQFSKSQEDTMLRLHKEMEHVLQILVQNNGVHIGEYKADKYSRNWSPLT